jgi:hypothetical protein
MVLREGQKADTYAREFINKLLLINLRPESVAEQT